MASVAVMLTAAMIRIVVGARTYSRWFVCELCGEAGDYVVECGEHLCGACLLARRRAWREQNRAAWAQARWEASERKLAEERAEVQERRDFEGDVGALDLARDGFWDELYEEFVGSETVGPKPRWVVETTLAPEATASPNSYMRWLFAALVYLHFPALRVSALLNMKVQLDEIWYVSDGFRDVTTMYDGTDDRDLGDDMLAWLHRTQSTKSILNRWNRPADELEFMDRLREEGRENEWYELMVDFRRRKLDLLLKEYFGLDDYRASMIVLKWEKASSGRWRPAKQMNVVDWVKWSCEQSGSTLGGLQSCTQSIVTKTLLRARKEKRAKVAASKRLAVAEARSDQRAEIRDGKVFVVTVLPYGGRDPGSRPVGLRLSASQASDDAGDEWKEAEDLAVPRLDESFGTHAYMEV